MAEDGNGSYESLWEKFRRHLGEGEKPSMPMFIRVVEEAGGRFRDRATHRATYTLRTDKENAFGHQGLRWVTYGISTEKDAPNTHRDAHFFEFPFDSFVRHSSKTDKKKRTAISNILSAASDPVFAVFTGPTFDERTGIPNNGSWTGRDRDKVEFMETNPPGQPRGALAWDTRGRLHVVSDEEKWQIIRNDYMGYEALIGTSFFFTNKSHIPGEIKETSTLSQVSYLIQHTGIDQSGARRSGFCYFVTNAFLPRILAMRMIRQHVMTVMGAGSFIAVELELSGAGIVIRNGKRVVSVPGAPPSPPRQDMYYVTY